MAEEAVKQKHGHLSYLEALLGAEVEDRYQHGVARRITEAHDQWRVCFEWRDGHAYEVEIVDYH
jgi:toxin HigB-1